MNVPMSARRNLSRRQLQRAKPSQQTAFSPKSSVITRAMPHVPHADVIDDRLETLSASTPAPSAPNRHPSSSTAATVQYFRGGVIIIGSVRRTYLSAKLQPKKMKERALINPRSHGPIGQRVTKSSMTSTFAMTPWSYPNVRPPIEANTAQRSAYVLASNPASPVGPYVYE